MPEPAAELTLYCYESARKKVETADEIIRECGFYPSVVGKSTMDIDNYTIKEYEPYEERDKNTEILDECVQSLSEQFSEMEVWLRTKSNDDQGNPVSRDHHLCIAPSQEVV